MINWDVTREERRTIQDIADRASASARRHNRDYPRRDAMMDITATHANGCRLRLEELLSAEPFDFVHDVFGIRRHLNRETGQLEDFFVPRFAQRSNQ